MSPKMPIYDFLNGLFFCKSFLGKFQFVAFFGVHVPLLSLIIYLLWFSSLDHGTLIPILTVALLATLFGSFGTMWIQKQLMKPVALTSESLRSYYDEKKMPDLPLCYQDEVGTLMASTQQVLTELDGLLRNRMEFMAILSHDIRSPLNAIMILADLVESKISASDPASLSARKNALTIKRIAEYQLTMMNHLLQLIRSETSSIQLQTSSTTLDALLEKVELTVQPIATGKNVDFSIIYEQNLKGCDTICLDSPKTVQILNNLALNAVKFVQREGKVELRVERRPDEIVFRIRDNGIGMDEKTCNELFVPFSTASREGTGMEMGTGLGLWTCKIFTEAQGGRIEVKSALHQGSCFSVIIPQDATHRLSIPPKQLANP